MAEKAGGSSLDTLTPRREHHGTPWSKQSSVSAVRTAPRVLTLSRPGQFFSATSLFAFTRLSDLATLLSVTTPAFTAASSASTRRGWAIALIRRLRSPRFPTSCRFLATPWMRLPWAGMSSPRHFCFGPSMPR